MGPDKGRPLVKFFLIFMHFLGKISQIVGWCTPPLCWEILDPPRPVVVSYRSCTKYEGRWCFTGLLQHRENGEFENPFFKTGKTRNLLKGIKNMFLHREFTTNTGEILRVKKNNELVIYCVIPGSWSVNFWLLFCKLLRGQLKWVYSGLNGSLGRERMAMVMMEAFYKLKYFIVCRLKNTGIMARAQGKHREFGINLNVATLFYFDTSTLYQALTVGRSFTTTSICCHATPKYNFRQNFGDGN